MKLYDKENKRLGVFEEKATPDFWDKHWQLDDFVQKVKSGKKIGLLKNLQKVFEAKGKNFRGRMRNWAKCLRAKKLGL